MDKNLPVMYKNYGTYSNWRNMPLDLDGLKPVERRVLLSAYTIARGPKYVKSRQVDAYTIGHFHPHGECYGTIVQLVRQGFLDGQGNFGSNVGVEPTNAAAPRYTECRISKRSLDIAFKYIKYVNWVDTELQDKEPIFLPTMYPICLMGNKYTEGIGFGYKTYIPCYKVEDLRKRLLWLLGIRKTKPTIAPISDCTITSPETDLELLLTTGKAKIAVQGIVEVNNASNILILKSWPPGRKFESFLNKFSNELDSGLIGFSDLSQNEQTRIVFQVLRERNRDKIFQDFVKKMKNAIQGNISFETTVVDMSHQVIVKPIDKMLLDTYKMFLDVNQTMLQDKIDIIDNKINEYTTLEKIRTPLSECINSKLDIPNTLKIVNQKTGISENIIDDLIKKYNISKLLTLTFDTTELNTNKSELINKLNNIKDFVMEQYNEQK